MSNKFKDEKDQRPRILQLIVGRAYIELKFTPEFLEDAPPEMLGKLIKIEMKKLAEQKQ